jgi:hypothetical protein
MAEFDELRKLYTVWQQRHRQHEQDTAQLVLSLARGLTAYLEAPATYADMATSGEKRYIEPVKAVRDKEGCITFRDFKFFTDAVTQECDGYWISGICVTLDEGSNYFPKSRFTFLVRFALRGTKCEIYVGREKDNRFDFDTADAQSVIPIYEYMKNVLRDLLSLPPWGDNQNSPIGFALPRSGSD